MRMPWHRTAEAAELGATAARDEFTQVQEQWPRSRELAFRSRHQRELNGWTARVLAIFSGEANQ